MIRAGREFFQGGLVKNSIATGSDKTSAGPMKFAGYTGQGRLRQGQPVYERRNACRS